MWKNNSVWLLKSLKSLKKYQHDLDFIYIHITTLNKKGQIICSNAILFDFMTDPSEQRLD